MAEDDKENNNPPESAGFEEKDTKEKGVPKEKIPTLVFNNLQEVGSFVTYLGDFQLLEFAEAVEDNEKKVLIQKNTILRKGTFESLQKRNKENISKTFVFKYTKDLRNKCKELISKSLYQCLEPKRYHIAQLLVKKSTADLIKIGENIFESKTLLDFFMMMDRENEPIIPHLGETALVATGMAERFINLTNRGDDAKEILKLTFLASLLHDIGLKGDSDFLANDLEKAKESGHEKKSQEYINKIFPTIDKKVSNIIASHHRTEPKYTDDQPKLLSMEELASECLNFTEYFFTLVRMSYLLEKSKRGEHLLENVFFALGHAFGQGLFHPTLYKVMNNLQESFQNVMKFGQDIGKLEARCLFKKDAIAYPVPLCTQILCKKKRYDCKWVVAARPVNIVQYSKIFGRAGESLAVGTYPKCILSEDLPIPPKELSGL